MESTDPHTEAGRLGLALNAMLGRIESALAARTASEQRLRQFLADASHELRTPLTSIRGFAELYRRGGAQPGPALDETMGRIEAEAARMALLVDDLLLLARLDEERPLERRPVDLLEIAADAIRDAHARAPAGRSGWPRSTTAAPFEPVTWSATSTGCARSPPTWSPTRCSTPRPVPRSPSGSASACRGRPPSPVAAVGEATGRPVPRWPSSRSRTPGRAWSAAQAARVFERLYRADPSRTRAGGGAGLGLSIVAAIVAAHRGRVELRTAPGAAAPPSG